MLLMMRLLGYTLNTQSVPENQLGPYVQEVLDQVRELTLPSSRLDHVTDS